MEPHSDQRFGCYSYSQHGEDLVLLGLFETLQIDKPSYLDIGAYHPRHISNTALLYKRGSRGVNVEANPNLIDAFKDERPEDINLCNAIVTKEQLNTHKILYCFDRTSGRNSLIEGYLGADPNLPLPTQDRIDVFPITINTVVRRYCQSKFPHFLSIDIEGLDYDVLESADFENLGSPTIICAESLVYEKENMERLVLLLESKGFVSLIRLHVNLLFIQKHLYKSVTR